MRRDIGTATVRPWRIQTLCKLVSIDAGPYNARFWIWRLNHNHLLLVHNKIQTYFALSDSDKSKIPYIGHLLGTGNQFSSLYDPLSRNSSRNSTNPHFLGPALPIKAKYICTSLMKMYDFWGDLTNRLKAPLVTHLRGLGAKLKGLHRVRSMLFVNNVSVVKEYVFPLYHCFTNT